MTEFKYVITDELGIHARPAGMLVKEAKKFASTIKLATAAKTVDAKGIMGVMSLGAKKGDEVTVKADGADEADAAAALEAFFKANL
ncbi:MAG: HPr family phosphocarrier protein [Lachnospiraceae bacterium]|nr:HPr family phosphocarrier protein [Lachnospiraceae bacterium]